MNVYIFPGLAGTAKEKLGAAQTANKIITIVESYFETSMDILKGKYRGHTNVKARSAICYLLREHVNTPYKQIGAMFNRDHTTMLNAMKFADQALFQEDTEFIECVNLVNNYLNNNFTGDEIDNKIVELNEQQKFIIKQEKEERRKRRKETLTEHEKILADVLSRPL